MGWPNKNLWQHTAKWRYGFLKLIFQLENPIYY